MVGYCHELGQVWIPEDGIIWQADVGDVEVDQLGVVVVVLPESDREADLAYRGGGAVSNSREMLGRLKLIIWHLKVAEHLDGHNVDPCAAIGEGPGNLHVADDWRTKHREDASGSRTLELIC